MLDSISFFRMIKTGFVNFWRNLWLSLAATMVMTITLVIFSVLFILFGLTNYSIQTIQNKVDISVYFKPGITESQVDMVKADLLANPKIKDAKYTSAETVLKDFQDKHRENLVIQQSINELNENPFPATLNVSAKEIGDYPLIAEQLKSDKYSAFIDSINYEDNRPTIEFLNKVLKYIIAIGLGLLLIFCLIAVLVIFNTIRLTIYNRKEEVEIMRLVGATNWYIRGPFLTESILYAVFGSLLTSFLLVPVFMKILPKAGLFVDSEVTVFSQNIFSYWYLLLILLVLAVILAVVSTLLAIRKYLKI